MSTYGAPDVFTRMVMSVKTQTEQPKQVDPGCESICNAFLSRLNDLPKVHRDQWFKDSMANNTG